ncbi:MAG: hypothetical protein R8F63_20790 [Acidimicrobiales bacterium]|nr:hypothetical protein [Acidimicrobiales bacterium]
MAFYVDTSALVKLVVAEPETVHVTPAVFESAGRLDPSGLRSLDAIHLASALDLGDDLDGLITYDDSLADAAVSNGVPVVASR